MLWVSLALVDVPLSALQRGELADGEGRGGGSGMAAVPPPVTGLERRQASARHAALLTVGTEAVRRATWRRGNGTNAGDGGFAIDGELGDVLIEYASKTKTIKHVILRAIANLLQLDDEDYFVNRTTTKAKALARLGYYPRCPRPDLVLGFKPHYDAGALSILYVEGYVDGLQVLKDGKWYDIISKPYTLLINIAECMEIMNNGIFKSPPHRVLTNAAKERISVAIFYGVNKDTTLEPAPGLLDEKRTARYRKVTAEDYYASVFGYFRQGKRLIDTLKI